MPPANVVVFVDKVIAFPCIAVSPSDLKETLVVPLKANDPVADTLTKVDLATRDTADKVTFVLTPEDRTT